MEMLQEVSGNEARNAEVDGLGEMEGWPSKGHASYGSTPSLNTCTPCTEYMYIYNMIYDI